MQPPKPDNKHIRIVKGLFEADYTGNENAVKTANVLEKLANMGIAMKPQTLRAIIQEIRRKDMLAPNAILSDVSAGYWLSADKAEMSAYIDKQMNRMANQFQNLKPLHQRIRYAKKEVTNELELFTQGIN